MGLLLGEPGVADFVNDEDLWRQIATHALLERGSMGRGGQVARCASVVNSTL